MVLYSSLGNILQILFSIPFLWFAFFFVVCIFTVFAIMVKLDADGKFARSFVDVSGEKGVKAIVNPEVGMHFKLI